jgi:LmbE family N-acetylglucosaminyl deacetylase
MKKLFEVGSGLRVVAFGAHPDDVELGAGGLVARLAEQGAEVWSAVVSVPNRFDERIAEAREGARILGVQLALLNRSEQGRVEDQPMHQLVARLDGLVSEVRPDLVITHAASDLHWDHRLVHHATVAAVRRTPCDLLTFMSSPEMNAQAHSIGSCFADVTRTIDKKLASIAAHASQIPRLDVESARDLARAMGRLCGAEYAESFEVLRIRI